MRKRNQSEINFDYPKLKYIRMNACYSARCPDFAVAAGIINGEPYYDPLGDRIYLGWKYSVPAGVRSDVEFAARCYSTFEVAWFNRQGMGGESIKQAFDDATWDVPAELRPYIWKLWKPWDPWWGIGWNVNVWGVDWESFHFGQ